MMLRVKFSCGQFRLRFGIQVLPGEAGQLARIQTHVPRARPIREVQPGQQPALQLRAAARIAQGLLAERHLFLALARSTRLTASPANGAPANVDPTSKDPGQLEWPPRLSSGLAWQRSRTGRLCGALLQLRLTTLHSAMTLLLPWRL